MGPREAGFEHARSGGRVYDLAVKNGPMMNSRRGAVVKPKSIGLR
jgi:hypothetical protein